MSFFASRKPVKGVPSKTPTATNAAAAAASTNGNNTSAASVQSKPSNGVSNSGATTSINKNLPVTSKATTPTTTKLVSVTRKVVASAVPQTLKERQALARAKRAKELEKEAHDESRQLAIEADARSAKARQDAAKRRKLDKGKSKAINDDSRTNGNGSLSKRNRSNSSPSDAATPARKSRLRVDSSDHEGSSRLGTPVFERKQPLRVPRTHVAAPQDNLEKIDVISGEQHVRRSMNDFVPYFPDIPPETIARLEYPGNNAYETFLLVRPRVKDGQDYHPIQDILSTVRIVLDNFLTSEQAMEHFRHVQNQSTSGLSSTRSDFDFLNVPSPSASRSGTPIPDSAGASPEPTLLTPATSTTASATGSPAPHAIFSKQPLLRLLEKAHRRDLGKDFLAALEYYNATLQSLKASGAIRTNIEAMGKEQGIPEAVWMKITGQCYERTVGPRIEELKKYEAFSDSVYGELLPPFVAHIASLTGLKEDSVMVDMGSGVGNCVVQASLATGCKSYGFEYQTSAASIAAEQTKEVFSRARLWGLKCGPCETHECDFLASPSLVGPALRSADVVIINNYVFSPTTNEALSLMFLDLKEGAKIVSLKPFVHQSGSVGEITERNAYSPASILNQSKPIVYTRGSVSWSDEPGKFYVATVNRDRLRRFLERHGEKVEF